MDDDKVLKMQNELVKSLMKMDGSDIEKLTAIKSASAYIENSIANKAMAIQMKNIFSQFNK